MESTETKELVVLKERISEASDADHAYLRKLYNEAQVCVLERLEILVASGLLDSYDFDHLSHRLSSHSEKDVEDWRKEVLSSIDVCLDKYRDYQRLRKATPGGHRTE